MVAVSHAMNAYCAGRSASSHGEKHWNSRCFRSRRPTRAEAHSLRLPVTTSAQCRCMCVGGVRRALTAPRTREVLSRAVYSKRHDDGPTSNADRHVGPRWKSSHPSGWRISRRRATRPEAKAEPSAATRYPDSGERHAVRAKAGRQHLAAASLAGCSRPDASAPHTRETPHDGIEALRGEGTGRHARRRIPRGMLTFRRCFSRARGPLPWRRR